MTTTVRPRVRVQLPRPRGTRSTSRVELLITMHPSELVRLKQRAAAASMSLTGYVSALLESDREDVPGARGPSMLSLARLADVPVSSEGYTMRGGRCPSCGHPEALHELAATPGGRTCGVSDCCCAITPAEWRAASIAQRDRRPETAGALLAFLRLLCLLHDLPLESVVLR